MGLWRRYLTYPVETTIHVYPDMKQLAEYAVFARKNRLNLLGVRRTRQIGQDNEFERLRDYTLDDNYRYIDWRASARRLKLTVKDFQTSQSQRIIFLLDCGRLMTGESSGLSLLDHSLNAALMLSYVALKQGDSVGLIAFADEILSYVPPQGGMNQMNRFLHAAFDKFPKLVESRYDEAFLYLNTHCRKRSLVVPPRLDCSCKRLSATERSTPGSLKTWERGWSCWTSCFRRATLFPSTCHSAPTPITCFPRNA